jgi:hypothetical protein
MKPTETELATQLNLLGAMPGNPPWSLGVAGLYSIHVADWDIQVLRKTVLQATATCQFRPTVAELKEIALRYVAPLPSLGALRDELRQAIIFYLPAERARRSTPLLNALADELGGWREIGMMDSEELDRRFPGACERARKDYVAEHAQNLLTAGAQGQLEGSANYPLELAA